MKLKLTWLLTLFMAFVMQFSFAQEKTITGTVTAASDGLPLPGVNVIVKGTTRGTQTDFDGKYSIKANTGEILVFSFVSMKTTEKPVGAGSAIISVAMAEDTEALEEVVVVGYRNTTKTRSNVSSVSISSETIENRPNASFVQTLSGQIAGLDIATNSGQPGGNSLVQLRGVASINGNTEPLFIIDGTPVDEDNFRSLNPQDIASIDVLKDAGATAIYGNRGANGVIIIKTRGGNYNQALSVSYNGFMSYSTLQENDYNGMNSQQQLTLERTAGSGRGVGLTDAEIAAYSSTDWTEYFFRTGVTQSHTVSLSSGSESATQFTSFGFTDTQGILLESDLKRFNIRSNVSGKSKNEKFNYGSNFTINYSSSNEPNSIGTSGINQNYVLGAYISVPYVSPDEYTNGADLLSPLTFVNTPLFLIDKLANVTRIDEEVKIVGSFNASYALTDWMTANVQMGADYQNQIFLYAEEPDGFTRLLFGGGANPFDGRQNQQSTRSLAYNQVTSLNFNKSFGKHTFDVGLYTEYYKAHLRDFGYAARGIDLRTFYAGDGNGLLPDTGTNDFYIDNANANIQNAGLFSYFGSFDYDYDEKYGLAATYRRDASYRFSGSNRWASFYSVSGRWNISNEDFLKDSNWVNVLKLRASYGTAGNQDIVGGGPFSAPALTEDLFGLGAGYGNQNSVFLTQVGNRGLQWETIATGNIGLDFELFDRRLRGAIDVYERQTTELFQGTPLSWTTGFGSLNSNTGSLFNRGIDLELKYDLIRATKEGGLNVNIGVVGNYNETEIQEIPNEDGEIIGLGRNGGKLFEYNTVRYAGVNPATGNLLFYDANGNVTESPSPDNDRQWLDKNAIPDANGSINLNVDYKGFYLTTQWNYVIGVDRFDNDYADLVDPTAIGQFRHSTDILRAWTQPGDITDIPSLTANNVNVFGSTRFLRSADYLRLRFATFGYRFSKDALEGIGIDRLTLFVNAENLVTFSEWRGYDAENRTNGSRLYPTPRTISFGIELGL